jgi:hypothetical protein
MAGKLCTSDSFNVGELFSNLIAAYSCMIRRVTPLSGSPFQMAIFARAMLETDAQLQSVNSTETDMLHIVGVSTEVQRFVAGVLVARILLIWLAK